jgi:hypothetical protein
MTSIADGSVIIQTSSESFPSPPSWFGEVVLLVSYLRKQGVLTRISQRVRFARRRGVCYEVIDFLAILFGYARSFERTLEAFYERLQPFVEALRTLFLDDLESRPLAANSNDSNEKQTGGLVDRAGNAWVVFDIDGTREAARQRALPPDRRAATSLWPVG